MLSRGVSIYKGKLFRVTPNDHVLAIDAKTGKLLWDVLLADKGHGYWLSAAPIAYDGRVFIGEAGADWGANGHIYALDAETGKLDWTFNVIPTGKEFGAESWNDEAKRGGGSMWSTYTLQADKHLLYVSVGNPAPDFNGAIRPGNNLFTDSVVVLDYRTGKLAWYVQQTPHDTHDWDTAAAPVVYDQGGKGYMAVANKGGWLYIYDRATHKRLAQPEVSPHENAAAPLSSAGVHHCPGIVGGVQWNGPAYSPRDALLFVNSLNWCGTSRLAEHRYVEGSGYFDGNHTWDVIETAKGWTRAFDAATGKPVWSRETPSPMLAALTPTAGGVVFTGELSGDFLALDSKSGEALYRFNTGGAMAGAPSTYLVDGKQYVAITTGSASRSAWKTTGAMTLVIFSLPEKE
jgi:glucose dehydrogenase